MDVSYQIIYLNGPTSSGKSTIAKALQQEFEEPFLSIGIDKIIGMMPEKINNWEGGDAFLGFSWRREFDEENHFIHEIQKGPFAEKIVGSYKKIVLTLAKEGHFLIVDDVSFGKKEVNSWRKALKDYQVLWVGIKAPLSLLEAREKERNNRMHGSARAQRLKVHEGVTYDLEFDTSKKSVEEIVQVIKEKVCTPKS